MLYDTLLGLEGHDVTPTVQTFTEEERSNAQGFVDKLVGLRFVSALEERLTGERRLCSRASFDCCSLSPCAFRAKLDSLLSMRQFWLPPIPLLVNRYRSQLPPEFAM